MLLPGTLDVLVLKAVSLGPLHGYGVLLRIEQITRGGNGNLKKDPCGHVKKDPPVSSVCCQLLTSFLELIGRANVRFSDGGSEPDVGVGHARSGYPRETERPAGPDGVVDDD